MKKKKRLVGIFWVPMMYRKKRETKI